jgi:hypothetical protein
MQNKTPEQLELATKHFVVKAFSVALVALILLFAYSVIWTEQPLYNEAPADKQIFGVLILVVGQILTILANYLSRGSSVLPPPMPMNPCQPQIGYQPALGMQSGLNNFQAPQNNYPVPAGVGMAWTPPPAPTNPPHHLESDDERAAMAAARESTRGM